MKIAHIFANDHFEVRGRKTIASSEKKGYKIIKILKKGKSERYPVFVWMAIKTLLKSSPDVIHAHRISGYIPAIIARFFGNKSKIIYDKHDTHAYDWFFDRLIFMSHYVLTNSELHLKKIKKHLGKKGVYVYHNYSFFKPLSQNENLEFRKKYDFKKSDFIILFQGSISPLSNPLNLLKALKKTKDTNVKLAIVGWPLDDKLWEDIKSHFSDRVKYLGSVPYEDMNGIISMSDVGTVAFEKCEMTDMGDPNKLWEAMACKKPVIVSNVLSIAPVVRKYKNGVVATTPLEIKNAIVKLQDKKFYAECVKNTPNLTWGEQFSDYDKILKKLCRK